MTDTRWRDERTDTALRAELDARHPERTKLRPKDIEGVRDAIDVVSEIWTPTIERARQLPQPKVHDRVNGEYSFVETLRHLLFAWEVWLRDVIGPAEGFHEWAIPPDLPADAGSRVMWQMGAGWSTSDVGPELEPVLEVRAAHRTRLRDYAARATTEDLKSNVTAPPWYPQPQCPLLMSLLVILGEEWWHHQYAARDLAILERG